MTDANQKNGTGPRAGDSTHGTDKSLFANGADGWQTSPPDRVGHLLLPDCHLAPLRCAACGAFGGTHFDDCIYEEDIQP